MSCGEPAHMAPEKPVLPRRVRVGYLTHLTRQGRKRCNIARYESTTDSRVICRLLAGFVWGDHGHRLEPTAEGEVSPDQGTRYLAGTKNTASDLWRTVKSFVRAVQSEGGVWSLDDLIAEKPYTDENDSVCWHYDHAKERRLKGITCLTAL